MTFFKSNVLMVHKLGRIDAFSYGYKFRFWTIGFQAVIQ